MHSALARIVYIVTFLSAMAVISRAELSLSEQLTHSTIRIETQLADGRILTGTGFFYLFLHEKDGRNVPAIVTNKHVVRGAKRGAIVLNRADESGNYVPSSYESVAIDDCEKLWLFHPSEDVDLAILPIGGFLNEQAKAGKHFFFVGLDDSLLPTAQENSDFTAIEDIVMIGYPNGIWDQKNNRPIVRRGITATAPNIDYTGKREFMIDAACFPGSSGSPVFLFNQGSYATKTGSLNIGSRVKLLGILYAGPQHIAVGEMRVVPIAEETKTVSVAGIPNNLGVVIKADRLKEFEPLLKKLQNDIK